MCIGVRLPNMVLYWALLFNLAAQSSCRQFKEDSKRLFVATHSEYQSDGVCAGPFVKDASVSSVLKSVQECHVTKTFYLVMS